jgi:hypothetical protein
MKGWRDEKPQNGSLEAEHRRFVRCGRNSPLHCSPLPYLRFADPSNMHMQERLRHARALNMLWVATLYSSLVLSVASIFGLGWGRWIGLAANAGAFLCDLMVLGAMCGPFGCR